MPSHSELQRLNSWCHSFPQPPLTGKRHHPGTAGWVQRFWSPLLQLTAEVEIPCQERQTEKTRSYHSSCLVLRVLTQIFFFFLMGGVTHKNRKLQKFPQRVWFNWNRMWGNFKPQKWRGGLGGKQWRGGWYSKKHKSEAIWFIRENQQKRQLGRAFLGPEQTSKIILQK